MSKPIKQSELAIETKVEKILEKHFPDEMDNTMYHPNQASALIELLALIQEQKEEGKREIIEKIRNTPMEFLSFHDGDMKDATFIKEKDLEELLDKLKPKEEKK